MVDTIDKLWLLVVGCTSRIHTHYRRKLAKDWERPTKRAVMAIIMHIVVTLHTTACCSMPVVDITCAKYQSANITSLRVVQQNIAGP